MPTETGRPDAGAPDEQDVRAIGPLPPPSVWFGALTQGVDVSWKVMNEDLVVERLSDCSVSGGFAGYRWYVGCEYFEPMSPSVTNERRPLVTRALETGRVLMVDGMLGGQCRRTIYRPFDQDGRRRMFSVCWPGDSCPPLEPSGSFDHVVANAHDLGDLSVLTEREIEVLSLIGRGMTNDEIAGAIHRSVKTVQGHRLSLGVKLGTSNRVQVARIALHSGLSDRELDDVRSIWRRSRASAAASVS
ncbi:MAG: helix-turn-helix transcriptional regulator [Planctomycetota bacterium]